MLAQEVIDIGPEETAGEVEARLAQLGAVLSSRVIEQISAGTAQGMKQDKTLATKAPKLTKEHGLIDWNRPANDVCNHIRAMQPWPTAYTFWHRQGQEPLRIIIHKATVRKNPDQAKLQPGRIIQSTGVPLGLLVAASRGSQVEILELQPAGKRRMSAAEFIRGHRLQDEDCFGPDT
jgi:methionyl-tRNA formyltransferase